MGWDGLGWDGMGWGLPFFVVRSLRAGGLVWMDEIEIEIGQGAAATGPIIDRGGGRTDLQK
jgi:hypothetical protein